MLTSTFHRNYPVSTGPNLLAGSAVGSSGYSNDTNSVARFNTPRGIVRDGPGNAYIADQSNHAIRKMTPLGVVTTFAGTGSSGFVNGNGTSASFNNPVSLAIDSNSNIYVADMSNNAIRKIDSSANVTTFPFAVNGPITISVSADGSNALTIDSNYNINVYAAGADYGPLPMGAGNQFPLAWSVGVRNDGIFYYAPAPGSVQPTHPTNVTNMYRITLGSPTTQTSPTLSSVSVNYVSGTAYDVTFNLSTGWSAVTSPLTATLSGFGTKAGVDWTVYNGITATFTDPGYKQNWKMRYTFATMPPAGSYNVTPNTAVLSTSTITTTFNRITINGTAYGTTINGIFFYSPTQLYITSNTSYNVFAQAAITPMTLTGDAAVASASAYGIGPYFIVKSAQGNEYFCTNTTSNQIVSYSNQY